MITYRGGRCNCKNEEIVHMGLMYYIRFLDKHMISMLFLNYEYVYANIILN